MNKKINEQLLIKILATIDTFVDANLKPNLYYYDWNHRIATIKLTKKEDIELTKLLEKYKKEIENIDLDWH